ncbi:MAG: tRNA (adenosine(37)-N6)-threonylcarbamoyltransferase complex ATPase subunit type 1 TsaE [Bacillota bacterium]
MTVNKRLNSKGGENLSMQVETNSPEETKKIGKLLGGLLPSGVVISLNGDLGAGKTTFVQGLAIGLGIDTLVTSPTFNLIHEYIGPMPLYHVDAYRLMEDEDMEELGLDEYFYGTGVTVVEWAERITAILPDERLEIYIQKLPDDNPTYRRITVLNKGECYLPLVEELKVLCGC